jgi:hypothetical protein
MEGKVMEQQIANLWRFTLWGLGICTTGFFVLAGWMWYLVGQLHQRVTYSDLKGEFIKEIEKDIEKIVVSLKRIESALIGDMEKPGLMTKVRDMEKHVNRISTKCPKCDE